MKHLFSEEGEQALHTLANEKAVLAFDFDGTLSPIVPTPDQAQMPLSICRRFEALCKKAPVAIITGRNVEDLSARLMMLPKYLIGNHGVEGIAHQEGVLTQYQEICEGWINQIAVLLQHEQMDPGFKIEHKAYSVCLHYRLVRNLGQTMKVVKDAVRQLHPSPIIIGGKCDINLLPPGAPNKRRALEHVLMLEEKQTAFYIGDDETDELVFQNAPPEWVTVRIERVNNSAARFFLYNQNEMAECLQRLIQAY